MCTRGGGSLLILMHTRALMTYLSWGNLPCIKDVRYGIFKIKVNAYILNTLSVFIFFGESFKNALFYFYCQR